MHLPFRLRFFCIFILAQRKILRKGKIKLCFLHQLKFTDRSYFIQIAVFFSGTAGAIPKKCPPKRRFFHGMKQIPPGTGMQNFGSCVGFSGQRDGCRALYAQRAEAYRDETWMLQEDKIRDYVEEEITAQYFGAMQQRAFCEEEVKKNPGLWERVKEVFRRIVEDIYYTKDITGHKDFVGFWHYKGNVALTNATNKRIYNTYDAIVEVTKNGIRLFYDIKIPAEHTKKEEGTENQSSQQKK